MSNVNVSRQTVFDTYCGDDIKSEERKVGKVILVKRLVIKMRMNKPESSQSPPADRIVSQRRNKNAFCFAYDDMSNSSPSGDNNADLPAYFKGYLSQVLSKFYAYQLVMKTSAVNPLKGIYLASLETCQFSVECCYSVSSKKDFKTLTFLYIILA